MTYERENTLSRKKEDLDHDISNFEKKDLFKKRLARGK